MSAFYQCIICKHLNISIIDLHNHYVQHHNSTELSQAIIKLQGFKVLSNTKQAKKKYLQSINLDDNNNNNENLYNHVVNKTELQKDNICKTNQESNLQKEANHDKAICLLNCSQYIAWEHEFNKRNEINDEEFFAILESLCYDLSTRKRRGRKKKKRIPIDEVNTINDMQEPEIANKEMVTEIEEERNSGPSQISDTISFWNVEHSIIDKSVNDNITTIEVENAVKDSENKTTTLVLTEDNTHQNILTYDTLYNNFSWNSIINMNSDG